MTYLEYYKSLYEKYPEWDPGFLHDLDEMDLLDDIERISGILLSLPEGASLKMMAEAIDPAHTYKTTVTSEKGADRLYMSICRDGKTGEWHYRYKDGVPTEAEIRLHKMASLYSMLAVRDSHNYHSITRDDFKKGDHSAAWEFEFEYHTKYVYDMLEKS